MYEGMVSMKPEIENRHFFSGDDDFTYRVPQVYFECQGEIDHSQSVFDYSCDSVIMVKDNRAIKYTERLSNEILMTDLDGHTAWVDSMIVDCMGGDDDGVSDIRASKSYWIEEFDWNKSEKRKYRVVLEEITQLEEYDEAYLKSVIDRDSKCISEEYVLADLEN